MDCYIHSSLKSISNGCALFILYLMFGWIIYPLELYQWLSHEFIFDKRYLPCRNVCIYSHSVNSVHRKDSYNFPNNLLSVIPVEYSKWVESKNMWQKLKSLILSASSTELVLGAWVGPEPTSQEPHRLAFSGLLIFWSFYSFHSV